MFYRGVGRGFKKRRKKEEGGKKERERKVVGRLRDVACIKG